MNAKIKYAWVLSLILISNHAFAAWAVQALQTSEDLVVNNDIGGSNGAVWMSDATGSFARFTWGNPGTAGLRWYLPDNTHKEIYVKFDMRRGSLSYNTKQLKLLGWGNIYGGGATSNFTFGPQVGGYGGGTGSGGVAYSDLATGGDNSCEPGYTGYVAPPGYPSPPNTGYGGTFSRTPYPTQVTTSDFSVDLNWHTYEFYVRYNDDGVANGEIIMKFDGVEKFHYTNMYNGLDSTYGVKAFGAIGLGEYATGTGPQIEDYRNFYVSYTLPAAPGC